MELLASFRHYLLGIALVVLALALLFSLIRAMAGPRFTDRIVAINMIGTQTILIVCILAFLIGEQYLVDVALVYSMISFLAVVALVNIYLSMLHERVDKARKDLQVTRHEHEIEMGVVRDEITRKVVEEAGAEQMPLKPADPEKGAGDDKLWEDIREMSADGIDPAEEKAILAETKEEILSEQPLENDDDYYFD